MNETTSYNSIATFEEQDHAIDESTLRSVGGVLIKHDLHETFRICLVHRHHELKSTDIMVHRPLPDGTIVCLKEQRGQQKLHAHAFSLAKPSQPQAFEYCACDIDTYDLDSMVLEEVSTQLAQLGVDSVLGISHAHDNGKVMVETLLPDDRGTVSTPIDDPIPFDAVSTEWAVCKEGDDIRIQTTKTCTTTDFGGHRRT